MSRITTSEPAYRAPLSQWQREQMRGEIMDAPIPFYMTTRGHIVAKLRKAGRREWAAVCAVAAVIVLMVLL